MTKDEEMAEEWVKQEYPTLQINAVAQRYIKSFLAGLKAGRQWHDLRKDPNDLPKENMKQVIIQDLDGDYYMGWYCVHQNCWYDDECPDTTDYPIKVIAWCEIPTFDKE